MILKGIKAAGKKPVIEIKMKNINQGTTENPLAFLENLREGLQI